MALEVQVVIDCADPAALAPFWAAVLGYRLDTPPAEQRNDANAVVDPAGIGPRLFFQRVPEGKTVKNRVHVDVRVGGPRGTPREQRRPLVDGAVVRVVGLGATHVRTIEDEDDYFAVMLDPEGNEFCLT